MLRSAESTLKSQLAGLVWGEHEEFAVLLHFM